MVSSPRIENTYGKDIRGNVLDQFDGATYDIKLYMLGIEDSLRNNMVGTNRPEVILAHTSSLADVQIEDVEITTVASGSSSPMHHSQVSFRLVQPARADFLDLIKITRSYLGYPPTAENSPLYMEINFVGYDQESGSEQVIRGPYRYRLEIGRIAFDVTPEGSTYDMECVFTDQTGYQNVNFEVPGDKTTAGVTVEDHLKNLEKIIQEHYEERASDHLLKDEYIIDTSDPSFSAWASKEVVYSDETADVFARTIDPSAAGLSTEELEDRNRRDADIAGEDYSGFFGGIRAGLSRARGNEVQAGDSTFKTRKSTTVEYFIFYILAMVPDFFNEISRTTTSYQVRNDLGYVKKLVIDVKVEYLDATAPGSTIRSYDPARNTLAKRFIYKPKLIRVPGETQVMQAAETTPSPGEQASRLSEMIINKAYYYMYTGLNDQIISVDLSYDHGHAILLAPIGGYTDKAQIQGNRATEQPGRNPDTVQSADDVNRATEERSGRTDANEVTGTAGLNSSSRTTVYARDLQANGAVTEIRDRVLVDVHSANEIEVRDNTDLEEPEKAMLLAYVYNNGKEESYLSRLNLTVRGDPFYLGNPNYSAEFDTVASENPEEMPMRDFPSCFVFEMMFPDIHNSETGEWQPNRKSDIITGVYQAVKIISKFSGGVYTNDITAPRLNAINLATVSQAIVEQDARES